MSALGGGFNRSTQYFLIVSDWKVSDGRARIWFTPQQHARRKRHVPLPPHPFTPS
jgi:hypothetical protein